MEISDTITGIDDFMEIMIACSPAAPGPASQVTAATMDADTYHAWTDVVRDRITTTRMLVNVGLTPLPGWQIKILTMACLCFIMINVGLEFDVDKSNLGQYGKDYLVAMTAAGFPWIFIALWFMFALPAPLPFGEALLAARFAAPTSAGILFSMLEAAGMRETWLFQKARVLAIFDDLDTILLMIPLKVRPSRRHRAGSFEAYSRICAPQVIVVGFRWELTIDAVIVVGLLAVAWKYLHALKIDIQWQKVMIYAAAITAVCEAIHVLTKYVICEMETIHLEVLMPAFVLGCVARSGHHESRHDLPQQDEETKAEKLFLPPTKDLGSITEANVEKSQPRVLKVEKLVSTSYCASLT